MADTRRYEQVADPVCAGLGLLFPVTQTTVDALLDEVRALRREVAQLRQDRDLGPSRADGDQLTPI